MRRIALLGAGGKMGVRTARNLQRGPYEVDHVEVSEAGRARLKAALGVDCVDGANALAEADAVVMAVPDAAIGRILHGFVDRLKPGAAVLMLDAAAPHAGVLPKRDDVTYFVTHPCHPPVFRWEKTREAQDDHFGGIAAEQAIVCALMQGPEAHYAACEAIARAMYAPVMRAHRVTVEQMAILEPALSETIGATLVTAIGEAIDAAAAKGVPREAAYDFMMGHLGIEMAIVFGWLPEGRFSDGALLAIREAKSRIFRDDWLKVLEPEAVRESVEAICAQGA
jgi:D-apionate oxidoisomerase